MRIKALGRYHRAHSTLFFVGVSVNMGSVKKLQIALLIVLTFIGIGTAGYMVLADYSVVDALYMTVITISTVGFGEIHPLTGIGRVFTVFLILSGVGSIAFVAGAFTELVIERASNPDRWIKTMEKKIEKLSGHVIVCGHGRVGAAAAQHLVDNGGDVVVIERSNEQIRILEEKGYYYLLGDGTREDILLRAGIKRASALLAMLNSDPENLFAVLTARELNPVLKIIARTEQVTSESRMLRAGADSVISPFVAAGHRVAETLLNPGQKIAKGVPSAGRVGLQKAEWLEVGEGSNLTDKNVRAVCKSVNGVVVGIQRNGEDRLLPEDQDTILAGDRLLIVRHELESFEDDLIIPPKKIVIVDDNPVIVRLYTRLFQKAGFIISSAGRGWDGYNLIISERPDLAVIDYHLPDMTGLQVCTKIRENSEYNEMKLVLFTADEEEETKNKAHESGIDRVVVKSPDASEIIKMVSGLLEK